MISLKVKSHKVYKMGAFSAFTFDFKDFWTLWTYTVVRRLRPFWRRAFNTLRPLLVSERTRKP